MTCPKCQHAVSRCGAEFCSYCGDKLPQRATQITPSLIAGGAEVCQITMTLCVHAKAVAELTKVTETRQELERVLRQAKAQQDELGQRAVVPCLAHLREVERELGERVRRAQTDIERQDAAMVATIRQWLAGGMVLEESARQVLSR